MNEPTEVIDMQERIDPITGESVFVSTKTEPHPKPGGDGEAALSGGVLEVLGSSGVDHDSSPRWDDERSIKLTNERFAAGPREDFFRDAERGQDAGHEARIENGRLVFGPPSAVEPDAVKLTDERFAAMTPTDASEIERLARSGAASMFVQTLQSTGQMPEYFPHDLDSIYLHTKPTRFGDELHVVIQRDPATRLYHAHLWAFMLRESGRLKKYDLNRWVGTSEQLSAHNVHLYRGSGGHGGVLCLTGRTNGGVPDLSTCVVRCYQWATGMGDVVRGRKFPFKQ